eukprot:SM000043S15794  [mRNA]  locus=s43:155067:158132:- [translate_table: standard]
MPASVAVPLTREDVPKELASTHRRPNVTAGPQSPHLEEGSEMHRSREEIEDSPGSRQGQEDGGERLLGSRSSDHDHYDLGQLLGLEGVASQVASSYRGPAKKRPSGPLVAQRTSSKNVKAGQWEAALIKNRHVLSRERNIFVRDAAIMVRPDYHIQTMVSPESILVHSIRVGGIRTAPKPCPISQVNKGFVAYFITLEELWK